MRGGQILIQELLTVALIDHAESINPYSTQQELSLKILCSPLSTDDSPTLESYANGLLSLKWSTPAGCPRADEGEDDTVPDSPGDNKKKKGRGFWGLMGLLFWLGFAGLISYFAIGRCRLHFGSRILAEILRLKRHVLQLHNIRRERQGPPSSSRFLARVPHDGWRFVLTSAVRVERQTYWEWWWWWGW